MQVSIRRCPDYGRQEVEAAFQQCMADLGGMERFVRPGQKVLVKVNLLKKNVPDEHTTTHPAVVRAVVRSLQAAGVTNIVLADSPGGPFTVGRLKSIYQASGMSQVAEETGAKLNWDTGKEEVYYPDGVILKQVTLCTFVRWADVVIDCAKLKTHGMTGYTGAVKNLFGCIPGTTKVEYHYRMPKLKDFSQMLLDLSLLVSPTLSVIDAIWGMEGDGPSAGHPRKIGALIAADHPTGADMAGITLIGQRPADICTIARAAERGLITGELNQDVTLRGDDLEPLVVHDFQPAHVADLALLSHRLPKVLAGFLERHYTPYPHVLPHQCVGCGVCRDSCPPGAITMVGGLPVIDLKRCIKCFCCHELCPKKAMEIKRPWLSKYL